MSASAMEQLYQQVILDHYKSPHGRGLLEVDESHACGESHQLNPTCGDEVTLRVAVSSDEGAPRISSLTWDGQGCSISQASLSVMTELTSGATVAEAESLGDLFRDLMSSRGKGLDDDDAEDRLGDATAFTGVSKFPARIKCALLGWAALRDALVRTGTVGEARATASAAHHPLHHVFQPRGAGMTTITPVNAADVEEAMRDVIDPELGINVVDLGLVYGITVDQNNHAVIDMTLTSAACPLTDVIEDQTSQALEGLTDGFRVNWVWMPPWGPEKITDDGRDQLRAIGFNV